MQVPRFDTGLRRPRATANSSLRNSNERTSCLRALRISNTFNSMRAQPPVVEPHSKRKRDSPLTSKEQLTPSERKYNHRLKDDVSGLEEGVKMNT